MTGCYDLEPRHHGEVALYSDGVHEHPLCDRHAEAAGFKPRETADELLARLGY